MQFAIPFYHLRQVCDQNSRMIHTLTAPTRGNTACDFQSTYRQTLVITAY